VQATRRRRREAAAAAAALAPAPSRRLPPRINRRARVENAEVETNKFDDEPAAFYVDEPEVSPEPIRKIAVPERVIKQSSRNKPAETIPIQQAVGATEGDIRAIAVLEEMKSSNMMLAQLIVKSMEQMASVAAAVSSNREIAIPMKRKKEKKSKKKSKKKNGDESEDSASSNSSSSFSSSTSSSEKCDSPPRKTKNAPRQEGTFNFKLLCYFSHGIFI
jgi:ribosomal protein L12E/L44/L45/RPP1/RPP2